MKTKEKLQTMIEFKMKLLRKCLTLWTMNCLMTKFKGCRKRVFSILMDDKQILIIVIEKWFLSVKYFHKIYLTSLSIYEKAHIDYQQHLWNWEISKDCLLWNWSFYLWNPWHFDVNNSIILSTFWLSNPLKSDYLFRIFVIQEPWWYIDIHA